MDSFLKADIFFFIASIVTILMGIFLVIILFYAWRIVRNVKKVSDDLQKTIHKTAEDVGNARKKIKEDGLSLGSIFKFFSGPKKKKKK